MGLFGALFMLACGTAHVYKDISESLDNEKSREFARRNNRKYYHALDGERTVDTNHKILRLPDGIKDMHTGEWLFDKRKQDAIERKQLTELDKIEKKESIIKGKKTYWCTLHESDPRRYGCCRSGQKKYQRLVNNDMPVESVLMESLSYYVNENNEKRLINVTYAYDKAKELNYGFWIPLNIKLGLEEKVFKKCKHWNMEYIMKGLCKTYPINKLEIVYKYCRKYNIPMGSWEEIESMMLEEHPLGWRKVPVCEDWEFEKFINSFIM